MSRMLDISVLLATYNRAGILRETLEQFSQLDLGDLRVEFVVVDNNSKDDTSAVAESFRGRLPLRVVLCPTPGKNAALNTALAEAGLGEIVVLTDDDVTPRPNWLREIKAACDRWPDVSVFGGTIQVIWPDVRVPAWAEHPFIRSFGFAHHEYSACDAQYTNGQFPHGPNYWVRRSVFEQGRRFDEKIGPRPENRILGDETIFLKGLRDSGYEIVYAPGPCVGHRIQPEVLSADGIRSRAYTLGRGLPYLHGLPHPELLLRSRLLWRWRRRSSWMRCVTRYALAQLSLSSDARVVRSVEAICAMASDSEALRVERQRHLKSRSGT